MATGDGLTVCPSCGKSYYQQVGRHCQIPATSTDFLAAYNWEKSVNEGLTEKLAAANKQNADLASDRDKYMIRLARAEAVCFALLAVKVSGGDAKLAKELVSALETWQEKF